MIAAGLFATVALVGASANVPPSIAGDWTNPKGTVTIRLASCGDAMCGRVIWASTEAREDARKGGTDVLVGTEVMRGLVVVRPGEWRGRIFIPDLNQTAGARLRLVGSNEIRVTGCRLGGLVCKAQLWRRLEAPAAAAPE